MEQRETVGTNESHITCGLKLHREPLRWILNTTLPSLSESRLAVKEKSFSTSGTIVVVIQTVRPADFAFLISMVEIQKTQTQI